MTQSEFQRAYDLELAKSIINYVKVKENNRTLYGLAYLLVSYLPPIK